MGRRGQKIQRRGFRPQDAPQLTVARNLDKAKGRRVSPADVAPHARALHPPCRGKGLLGLVSAGHREICKCATKRFLRAHPEIIMDAGGNAWWPVGGAPEERAGNAPER